MAENCYRSALRLDPAQHNALLILAFVPKSQRNITAALQASEQAFQVDPEAVVAAALFAKLHCQLGDNAMAWGRPVSFLTRRPVPYEVTVAFGTLAPLDCDDEVVAQFREGLTKCLADQRMATSILKTELW